MRAVHERGAHALGHVHAGGKHLAFDETRIFHADGDAGEQTLEHTRRREIIGRADFLQVDGDSAGRLGAIHHVAASEPLGVAEDVLADPGGWQVGQHFFCAGELVELGAGCGAVQQRVVCVHYPFRVPCGARGEEHGRHVVGLCLGNFSAEPLRIFLYKSLAGCDQGLHAIESLLLVFAQASGVVEIDVGNRRAAVTDFQHLVDLFLVFHHGKSHLCVVQREDALDRHGVLVQRHGNGTECLGSQHGGVQAWAVGADHHHMFATAQAGQVQAGCHLLHQRGQGCPAVGLPDAVFFFAQCRCGRALSCMLEQQLGERGLHSGSYHLQDVCRSGGAGDVAHATPLGLS